VSDLTETSQDVPGRTISKVATLVHLGLGQSIVLSGLDAESESHSKRGLPLLSRIPIIGYFFGVGTHREEQVEGLIAITPTVIENLDRDGRRRLEQALAKFEQFDGDFEE
jgi:type II secretory pathway component GspD/PulD (secretin)